MRAATPDLRDELTRFAHPITDATLNEQFDAVLHWDETRALVPLERNAAWDQGEPPETFPSGI